MKARIQRDGTAERLAGTLLARFFSFPHFTSLMLPTFRSTARLIAFESCFLRNLLHSFVTLPHSASTMSSSGQPPSSLLLSLLLTSIVISQSQYLTSPFSDHRTHTHPSNDVISRMFTSSLPQPPSSFAPAHLFFPKQLHFVISRRHA